MENSSAIICFECGVATTSFYQLPCNHVYCYLCVANKIFKKHIRAIQTCEPVKIACRCKIGFLKLEISDMDLIINTISPDTTETKGIFCMEHQFEVASIFCWQCKIWSCPKCIIGHNSSHLFRERDCITHKRKINDIYCSDCKKDICPLCILAGEIHYNHSYEVRENFEEKLRMQLGEVRKQIGTFTEFSSQLDTLHKNHKEKYDSSSSYISDRFTYIIQQMQRLKAKFDEQTKQVLSREELIFKIIKTVYSIAYFTIYNFVEQKQINISNLKFLSQLTWDLSNIKYVENNEHEKELNNLLTFVANINQKLTSQSELGLSLFPKKFVVQKSIDDAHSKGVTSLISLQDRRYVSASKDGSVFIWKDHRCRQTLTTHMEILALAYVKIGRFATGAADSHIKIWKESPSAVLGCVQTLFGHEDAVITLLQLADTRLVSGSYDSTIIIWTERGNMFECTQVLNDHGGICNYPVFKIIELSDERLASGSKDKTIKIWTKINSSQFQCVQTLKGHGSFWSDGSVLSLLQLKDNRIVSGSTDQSIRIWTEKDAINTNGNCFVSTQTLSGHTNAVCCLTELKYVSFASGSEDNTIRIWSNSQNGFECIQVLDSHRMGVLSLLQLKDGTLISASEDRTILIWRKIKKRKLK